MTIKVVKHKLPKDDNSTSLYKQCREMHHFNMHAAALQRPRCIADSSSSSNTGDSNILVQQTDRLLVILQIDTHGPTGRIGFTFNFQLFVCVTFYLPTLMANVSSWAALLVGLSLIVVLSS